MNKIINYLKSYLIIFIMFLMYLIIMSTIYYFELLSYKTVSIINYIFMIIIFFLLGRKVTIFERKKGYLNGFIIATILVILFSLISLLISKLTFSSLVYYLSLIISSMIGGILTINKKSLN